MWLILLVGGMETSSPRTPPQQQQQQRREGVGSTILERKLSCGGGGGSELGSPRGPRAVAGFLAWADFDNPNKWCRRFFVLHDGWLYRFPNANIVTFPLHYLLLLLLMCCCYDTTRHDQRPTTRPTAESEARSGAVGEWRHHRYARHAPDRCGVTDEPLPHHHPYISFSSPHTHTHHRTRTTARAHTTHTHTHTTHTHTHTHTQHDTLLSGYV
jgi:hypothetical protein